MLRSMETRSRQRKMDSPQFYHTTVLLKEAVDGLELKEDGVYVDATFGGGGHSKEILKKLGKGGKLIAFDQDEDAWRNKPDDERLTAVTENFRYMRRFLRMHVHGEVDGILADLGVSSYQFDQADRGFSLRYDGPMDMRMDRRSELTAAQVLRTYSEERLHKLFEQYGEVRNSKQLAKHIVTNRKGSGMNTIGSFKATIAPVMRGGNPNKYLAQVFQALRIEVNDELGVLKEFLQQAAQSLKPGGRLSVISFHSLEDRIVKQFIKRGHWDDTETIYGQPEIQPLLKPVNPKPIEPTEEEIKMNTRARSARLRIGERI